MWSRTHLDPLYNKTPAQRQRHRLLLHCKLQRNNSHRIECRVTSNVILLSFQPYYICVTLGVKKKIMDHRFRVFMSNVTTVAKVLNIEHNTTWPVTGPTVWQSFSWEFEGILTAGQVSGGNIRHTYCIFAPFLTSFADFVCLFVCF